MRLSDTILLLVFNGYVSDFAVEAFDFFSIVESPLSALDERASELTDDEEFAAESDSNESGCVCGFCLFHFYCVFKKWSPSTGFGILFLRALGLPLSLLPSGPAAESAEVGDDGGEKDEHKGDCYSCV